MLVTLILTLCSGTVCTQQQPFDAMPTGGLAMLVTLILTLCAGTVCSGYVLARYGCRAVQVGRKDAI